MSQTRTTCLQEYCFFCDCQNKDMHKILTETSLYFVRFVNPEWAVSPNHLNIVPKRHVVSFFDLVPEEVTDLYNTVKLAKKKLEQHLTSNDQPLPDGYNCAINEGEYAGRTVHHFHFHLIPRYNGDIENPRGGIVAALGAMLKKDISPYTNHPAK